VCAMKPCNFWVQAMSLSNLGVHAKKFSKLEVLKVRLCCSLIAWKISSVLEYLKLTEKLHIHQIGKAECSRGKVDPWIKPDRWSFTLLSL
jgi:hypothetical protein